MSKFSNELAPNLFKSYDNWYDNWVRETGKAPEKSVAYMACRYFDTLARYVELKCERCGHHMGWFEHIDYTFDGCVTFVCDHCRQALADNAMFGGEV